MKILYHHRIRSKDGQYVHLYELVNALRDAGHEVFISGPAAFESEPFGADAGIVSWLKRYIPKALYELMELGYSAVDYVRLARDIRTFRPDCIYERYNLHFVSGIWAKRRHHLPLILEVNGPLFEERKSNGGIALEGLAKWSETFCWRGADMCLPVTRVLADMIVAVGVPLDQIEVVPNAINLKSFQQAPTNEDAKASLGLSGRTVLGFVGFLRSWHGLERVIKMLHDPALEGCDLLVVGDGPARNDLESQVARLNLQERVKFTGLVSREEVARFVSAFDIALQPDVVEHASPLKIYEYLALGKAIVAPSKANIREILIHGENGLLFGTGSEDLRNAIATLVCKPALRAKLRQGALRTVEERQISWDANAQRVVLCFGKLLH